MFLLPMMQEMMYDGEYIVRKPKEKKSIEEYIFLKKGDKLLKFNASFSWLRLSKIIESYVNTFNINEYKLTSAEEVDKRHLPSGALSYEGLFRLEGNFKKTINYIAPIETPLLKFLGEKFINLNITSDDLNNIINLTKVAYEDGDIAQLKTIKSLIEDINVFLEESYTIKIDDINEVKQILTKEKDEQKISKLKWILNSSNENNKNINKLGLGKTFLVAAGLEKQNQKVK